MPVLMLVCQMLLHLRDADNRQRPGEQKEPEEEPCEAPDHDQDLRRSADVARRKAEENAQAALQAYHETQLAAQVEEVWAKG